MKNRQKQNKKNMLNEIKEDINDNIFLEKNLILSVFFSYFFFKFPNNYLHIKNNSKKKLDN